MKSSFTLILGCCNLQCFEQASAMDIYRTWTDDCSFRLLFLKVLQYFLYMNNYTLSSQYGYDEKKNVKLSLENEKETYYRIF